MNVKHVPSDLEIEYSADELEEYGERAGEVRSEYWSGKTNTVTKQFIKDRYVVLRDFIPKEIITMTLDSWKAIESNQEYHDMFFPEPEIEITHNSPESSLRKSEGCYCFPPAISLHHWLRNALKEVLDMHLGETYSYTRKYVRGAYLKAHTDRPSCEISVTLCLDYKTDDNTPWKIWVQNDQNFIDRDKEGIFEETQGLPVRKRTGKSVSLEPGDLLLYQGPNIPHWRDYLIGDYSYHMFLHFVNLKGKLTTHSDQGNVPLRPDNSSLHIANRPGRHVLSYDGREDRWDCSGNTNTQKKKDMEKWFKDWYSPMPNKADYVNCYDDIHFKEKKKKK